MAENNPIKHRLGLWLRSERALGLPSVPRVEFAEEIEPAPEMPRQAPPPPPVAQRPPAPQPARLFTPPAPEPASTPLPVFDAPFTSAIMTREEKVAELAKLNREQVKGCVRCGLSHTRTQTVFGEGDPDAPIAFVGEGPGREEDATGRPFVGRAGQKLDDMIRAMGLAREQVFICNIVKCRAHISGKDRPPTDDETLACTPYLVRQLDIVRPKVIVTLGLPSTRFMLQSKASMGSMRGRWHAWRGIKVMPTWHPAYVLRNYTEQTRREVWDDLKKVLVELSLPIPNRSGKQD